MFDGFISEQKLNALSQADGHATRYSFAEYEEEALNYRRTPYPDRGTNIIYPALAIAGEAGEFAEKVKKLWRNLGITSGKDCADQDRETLAKELGDILWYVGAAAQELGLSLEKIALANALKVNDRERRGVVKSEGDNR
jgi:NTP pyrophosphatase (non-canonical NTP hydrolase)